MRPKRLYRQKSGRYYYYKNGKKVYIKTPSTKLSQKQIVKININNVIGNQSRRVKPSRKRKRVNYTQKIDENMKQRTGLNTFIFEPKRNFTSLSSAPKPSKEKVIDNDYKKLLDEITIIKDAFKNLEPQKVKTISTTVPEETKKQKRKTRVSKIVKNKKNPLNSYSDFNPLIGPEDVIKDIDSSKDIKKGKKSREFKPPGYDRLYQKYKDSIEPDENGKKGQKYVFKKLNLPQRATYEQTMRAINEVGITLTPDEEVGEEDVVNNPIFRGKGNIQKALYNDELENISKKLIKAFTIPVIAQNELDKLDEYVSEGMSKFGAIINTDTIPQKNPESGHWTAVFINNTDDFKSVEFFDPLVSTPSKKLIQKLKDIAYMINPEDMFKFKINALKTQPDESDNCGFHSMLFLEKRFNNVSWCEASGYDRYMENNKPNDEIKGEGEVQKIIKKYSSYI